MKIFDFNFFFFLKGELKLLETGEYLYIPITQDPVPKTEDQLEEDAEILLQLGTDAHGSELRARLMSASLLSDMEAFKAANPGCILADFIRWYSPRDWIEEEDVDEFGQPKGYPKKYYILVRTVKRIKKIFKKILLPRLKIFNSSSKTLGHFLIQFELRFFLQYRS